MCKLSIIIPTYNIERYKNNCIQSILQQRTEKLEILLVDDGSTDDTKSILEKYQREYPKIINVIYKAHTGVADTRNIGIKNAKGKYIQFIDCDDYIADDLIKRVEEQIDKNTDIIKFKLKIIGNSEKKVDGPVFENLTGQEAFNRLYDTDVLIDSPCVYVFKKKIFIENNLEFQKNTEHEDFGLIPIVLLYAKSITSLDYYGYYYVQSTSSITRGNHKEKIIKQIYDVFKHYDNMLVKIQKMQLDNITKENIKIYYTNAILAKLKSLDKSELEIAIAEFNKRKMHKNIKIRNIKQLIKKIILKIDVKIYLNKIK